MTHRERGRSRIVAGRNAVLMAFEAGGQVRELLVETGVEPMSKLGAIVDAARDAGVPVREVARGELTRRAGAHHQGVAAVVVAPVEAKLKDLLARCAAAGREPCVVVLRELLHEHNLGAILRTADAAGADALVLPSRAAPLGAEAMRVSTGAGATVPVVRQSVLQALSLLRREGVMVIGAEPDAPRDYWDQDLTGAVAFVLGGEDRALSQPLRDACDALVRIPMRGRVTSLNVSVACALLLYERLRQTHAR